MVGILNTFGQILGGGLSTPQTCFTKSIRPNLNKNSSNFGWFWLGLNINFPIQSLFTKAVYVYTIILPQRNLSFTKAISEPMFIKITIYNVPKSIYQSIIAWSKWITMSWLSIYSSSFRIFILKSRKNLKINVDYQSKMYELLKKTQKRTSCLSS